jgi:hypothetical protein
MDQTDSAIAGLRAPGRKGVPENQLHHRIRKMTLSRSVWLFIGLIIFSAQFSTAVASGAGDASACREMAISGIQKLDLSGDVLALVEANPRAGFNFAYYIFIPLTRNTDGDVRLLVEPNNSGIVDDDLTVHQEHAEHLVTLGHAGYLARQLETPLLVPVFPRNRTAWHIYTHALDRDTILIDAGRLKRIDLQLLAMIRNAQALLRHNGIPVADQVFMNGFSGSGSFVNRFTALHPTLVKAVAAGGICALPILPIQKRQDHPLPYPIGIADLKAIAGIQFNKPAYNKVPQYLYMGGIDENDTLPYSDAWNKQEAELIKKMFGEQMMPDRWEITRAIYNEQVPRAQCVTYKNVGHSITRGIMKDLIAFFRANSGDEYVRIAPHVLPAPIQAPKHPE